MLGHFLGTVIQSTSVLCSRKVWDDAAEAPPAAGAATFEKHVLAVFWKGGETRPFLGRLLFSRALSHAGC